MRKPERQVPWEARFKAAQPADQALLSPVLLLPQAGLSRGTGNRSAQWAQLVIDAGTPLSPRSSSGSTESDGGGGGQGPTEAHPVGSFVVHQPYSVTALPPVPRATLGSHSAAGDSEAQGVLCDRAGI